MPRVILVTEGSSPLGASLARRLSGHGYAVAVASADRAVEGLPAGELFLSVPWNRRSSVSARTVLIAVENAFGRLDEAIILEPPLLVAPALTQASSADVDRALDDAKGPLLIARELLGRFIPRGSGVVCFVSGGPSSGPVEAAAREAFRGLAAALMSSPGTSGIIANGFHGEAAAPEDYAAFIDRTLEERARKISGRWFSLPGRGGFLQGMFRTSSSQ